MLEDGSSLKFIVQAFTLIQFLFSLVVWMWMCHTAYDEVRESEIIEEDLKWLLLAATYWVILCFCLWRAVV